MKGKAGSEDGWFQRPGPEEDEASWPAASACQRDRISNKGASDTEKADRGAASLRKLWSQDRVESPVVTPYVLDSDSE